MKKIVFALLIVFVLSGCQEDKVSPYQVLDEYITTWQDFEYQEMYRTYLSTSSKNHVSADVFEERYEKIYADLEVENLTIEILDREQAWEEETTVSIPGKIAFDTLVGKMEYEVIFELEKEIQVEEKENWFVNWDPSYILQDFELTDSVVFKPKVAERGEILDNEGNQLARNEEVINLGVKPGEFKEESLSVLSELINMSEEEIKSLYTVSWAQPDYLMPIKKFLVEDIEIVQEAIELDGVTNTRVQERVYPYGAAAAHLIGYIDDVTAEDLEKFEGYENGDKIGRTGIEAVYEDRLRGKNGYMVILEKEDGTTMEVGESDWHHGENIKLTINGNMQQTLYETIKEEAGNAVVMDPTSGKVLSLVSVPSYNPNDFVLGISKAQRTEIADDPRQPTMNRFRYNYSPGSTMKILTAIIGLESGNLDPQKKYEVPSGDKGWKKDDSWGGYSVTRVYADDTQVDLVSGLNNSDNIYFAQVGLEIGASTFEEGLSKLGIGETLPFSYPPYNDSQISNSGTLDSEIALADTAYGQGEILLNIVHLASIYAGVVNDGVMLKPSLMEEDQEVWKDQILSPENAKLLQENLRKIVTEGKSPNASIQDREMAGKTGTAEIKLEQGTTGTENGLFVAYDQNDPNILTAMLIENVEKKDPAGSSYTVGLVKRFYEALAITQR